MTRTNALIGPPCVIIPVILVIALSIAGCKNNQKSEASLLPPTVEVVNVIKKDVPLYSEWTASIDGSVNATIRAQVQGYLIKQDYREGDFVKEGQTLFEIDQRTFRAALEQAKGQLTEARARWETSKANLERIRPLVELHAVSMKDFDDAVGAERVNNAAVVAAQAMVDKAQVDLGFTRIAAPISGIAGIAKAQLGNLVGPGSIDELTTVSAVNPIKVYVSLSEQEYLRIVEHGRGGLSQMSLDLVLADGTVHPHKGFFAFADRQVDVKTGTIKVAALFPNPGNVLRPGQFARVKAQTMIKKNALLVPQRAVTELQGGYQVAVVGADNRVDIRPVKAAERIDNLWVIDDGLKADERVVAEGIQKIASGAQVVVKPFGSAPTGNPETKPGVTSGSTAKSLTPASVPTRKVQ
ncbi:MAG TPA: efflux RND transporter periplasmic adaptor subunit [Syntrophorhabdaceae bacterium]|nr:efflux RND transporter periplasmic adaptor subunit [Syntrophorhabdaceae bacterium]